jgi:pSer/pThr/pTyr-binding forkhead associated (FHA) protein
MAEILVKYDEKIIERVVTEKERISIGRTSDNDIVLDNRGVSRKHALIEFSGQGALLIDNESLNGTFVNQRKVTEQPLQDKDIITIGKFDLVFFREAQPTKKISDLEGTMVLNTKKQKELVTRDKEDKDAVNEVGTSVLIAVSGSDKAKFPLDKELVTVGKSSFANVPASGFLVSKIQAKLIREGDSVTVLNVGRKGKTRLNGEVVSSATLKNGDILEVGKSVFRFIEG